MIDILSNRKDISLNAKFAHKTLLGALISIFIVAVFGVLIYFLNSDRIFGVKPKLRSFPNNSSFFNLEKESNFTIILVASKNLIALPPKKELQEKCEDFLTSNLSDKDNHYSKIQGI